MRESKRLNEVGAVGIHGEVGEHILSNSLIGREGGRQKGYQSIEEESGFCKPFRYLRKVVAGGWSWLQERRNEKKSARADLITLTYVQAALNARTVGLRGVLDGAGSGNDGGDDGDGGETHCGECEWR